MIYDCFSFFNELDLLEIRLNILKDVVDRFVLVEATSTHTGHPKPLFYQENKDRFSAFGNKIIHVVVDDFPMPPEHYTEQQSSWMRENFQRNAIMRGLVDAKEDDLIVISDLDEIPRPEVLTRVSGFDGVTALSLEQFAYYLNFKNFTHETITVTRALLYKTLINDSSFKNLPVDFRGFDVDVNLGPTPTKARDCSPTRVVKNAGWHFSYIGGAEKIVEKIKSIAIEYAHEFSDKKDWIEKEITRGGDVTKCGGRFFAVPINNRFPRYVVANREKYVHLIISPSTGYYICTFLPRMFCRIYGWIRKYGVKIIPDRYKQYLYDKVYSRIVDEPIVI